MKAMVIYDSQYGNTAQERIQAFFKGVCRPAFLVYDLLTFLEKE